MQWFAVGLLICRQYTARSASLCVRFAGGFEGGGRSSDTFLSDVASGGAADGAAASPGEGTGVEGAFDGTWSSLLMCTLPILNRRY